jgi:hypothetical protein
MKSSVVFGTQEALENGNGTIDIIEQFFCLGRLVKNFANPKTLEMIKKVCQIALAPDCSHQSANRQTSG